MVFASTQLQAYLIQAYAALLLSVVFSRVGRTGHGVIILGRGLLDCVGRTGHGLRMGPATYGHARDDMIMTMSCRPSHAKRATMRVRETMCVCACVKPCPRVQCHGSTLGRRSCASSSSAIAGLAVVGSCGSYDGEPVSAVYMTLSCANVMTLQPIVWNFQTNSLTMCYTQLSTDHNL